VGKVFLILKFTNCFETVEMGLIFYINLLLNMKETKLSSGPGGEKGDLFI
jgi:hypothetical protein